MHLQDVPSLRAHLTPRLSALCDADPAALADYIIALLKHEKPINELKAFCVTQLADFLHDKTESFVEGIFNWLEKGDEPLPAVVNLINTEIPSNMMMRDDLPQKTSTQSQQEMASDEEMQDSRDRRPRRDYSQQQRRSRSPPYNRNSTRYEERRPHRGGRGGYSHEGERGSRYSNQMEGSSRYNNNSGARQPRRPSLPSRINTRLVIDRIPVDCCSITKVNEYFQKFGTIVNITVQPEIQRARLEYSSHEEANAAYTSPDVIFSNRFVKVFWDHEDLPTPSIVKGNTLPSFTPHVAHRHQMVISPSLPSPRTTADAMQKKQEALKGMLELQKQKQELLLKYITQQKEILGRLENKSLGEGERRELMNALKGVDELINGLKSTDTNVSTTPTSNIASTGPILRGPSTRGAYGGGKASLGLGAVFATRASHRLDLRPTAIRMKPIPSRVGRDIASIKKLFDPFGEIKNISFVETQDLTAGVIVSFVRRVDGEKAFYLMPKTDLGEPFELEWVQSGGGDFKNSIESPPSTTSEVVVATEQQTLSEDTQNNTIMVDNSLPEHIAFEEVEESHWKR